MISENFIILSIIIAELGELQYLWDTIRARAKPNRVTWLLWGIFPLVVFAAQTSEDSGAISLLSLVAGVTALLVVAASFLNKKAYWKTTKLDYVCLGLACMGMLLWGLTKDANLAILFSIIADLFAAIPTIIKAFKHPESESAKAYLISSLGFGFGLLTIQDWRFDTYAFVLYLFCNNFLIFVLTQWRPILMRRKLS